MALSVDVIDKLAALITAAFGLVAALAWNGAIQAVFAEIFGEQSTIPAMLGYAVFVTILAVIFTVWIGAVSNKSKALAEKASCAAAEKLHIHKKE
ncbi:MAG TPA: DUF5654 family protein [Methanocorpusculum sp.]|nr:DUF5654 family protein [Methanocorpusculum sp.]